jgi:succinate dehydrogenase/fumarate reductase cytochrome b subunit (b558 family)
VDGTAANTAGVRIDLGRHATADRIDIIRGKMAGLRKLHSLSGALPLGVFLIQHVYVSSTVLVNRAAFDRAVGDIQRMRALFTLEVLFVFLPLAFHSLYGIKVAFSPTTDAGTPVRRAGRLYVLQRVTGVVTFVFVCIHLWEIRVQRWLEGLSPISFYDVLREHLSRTTGSMPLIAIGYAVALACVAFHFANGIVGFTTTFGITGSRRGRRIVGWSAGTLATALFAFGFSAVVLLSTGTRLIPLGHETQDPPCGESK